MNYYVDIITSPLPRCDLYGAEYNKFLIEHKKNKSLKYFGREKFETSSLTAFMYIMVILSKILVSNTIRYEILLI